MNQTITLKKLTVGLVGIGTLLVAALLLAGAAVPFAESRVAAAAQPVAQQAHQSQVQAPQEAITENAVGETAEKAAEDLSASAPDDSSLLAPDLVQAFQTQSALTFRGDVLAQESLQIAVEVIGQVLQLTARVGDTVAAGDLLLQIDDTTLLAQRSQALAGLEAAEAQLNQLLLEANDSDIEAARAAVAAAGAGYSRALEGPTQEDLEIAEAQVRQAEAAVKQAQSAFNEIKWMPNRSSMPQSLALEQATLQAEAARAAYAKTTQGSTQDVINGAYAQLASARAQLDRLLAGANEPQLDAVRAQVRQAETGLLLADIQVAKAAVHAPISGVINAVNTSVGANVAPGAPVFELLSEAVKVVVNVEEQRRGVVYVGQSATIRANAYPDQTFAGEVTTISPSLDAATRTFEVTVQPVDSMGELVAGMSATVELGQ